MKAWLEENNKNAEVFVSDPEKGYNDDMSGIDVAFLQISVPTEDDGTQDLTLMAKLIKGLSDVPVFVRTTILPGTSERLSRETGRQVCYMCITTVSAYESELGFEFALLGQTFGLFKGKVL